MSHPKFQRKGKCEPEKCGALCCRVLEDSPLVKTINGVCVHLIRGRCSIQEHKPQQCRDFPNGPYDEIYQRVKGKCGYWFEKIEEMNLRKT